MPETVAVLFADLGFVNLVLHGDHVCLPIAKCGLRDFFDKTAFDTDLNLIRLFVIFF